jgi:hypothetical protein
MPFWLAACDDPPQVVAPHPMADPLARLVRASMALRGTRPSLAEISAVDVDPDALPGLVEGWLSTEEFGATVRDLHAESWLMRMTVGIGLPAAGPLGWADRGALVDAMAEAPLLLAEHVVVDRRPYTDVVTSPDTWVDAHVSAALGLPFDPAGPTWQAVIPEDGRPSAGILSQDTLWLRHITGDANRQRARAEFIADRLLCDAFSTRDLPVADLTGAEDAVSVEPACTACHDDLDPLASVLFGFRRYILTHEIVDAYAADCPDPAYCYPLQMYVPEAVGTGSDWGMPAPGYWGTPLDGLADLGAAVAADPRFASCSARRARAWLHQVAPETLDDAVVEADADALVAGGWDLAALLADLVLAPDFTGTEAVGPLAVRPEARARQVEAQTGFQWRVDPSPEGCPTLGCKRDLALLTDASDGFRVLMGGIDALDIVETSLVPATSRALVVRRHAERAADYAVDADFALPAASRRLLQLVEPDSNGETTVRSQIAMLHLVLLGERVPLYGAALDADLALWANSFHRAGGRAAWRALIAAMLQDDRAVLY